MNAFQLSSTQTFRQGFTVEPIGLHPLSWSSGDHRWSGDQAPIPLSRQPIIQPVPRGSSLIGKGHLLIRKVVAYMVQQVLHFIRHAQGSDESLMTAKSCRDALFVHVQAGKHIILPGDKRLVSHLSASFGQCLLFQALYQSTRIENRHPSYKSQDRPMIESSCASGPVWSNICHHEEPSAATPQPNFGLSHAKPCDPHTG